MSMFILLAIVSVIHGGICALRPPPSYLETHREVISVVKAIQENVFPIDYKKIAENASAEALNEPQKVIKIAEKVFDDLDEKTKTLQELINIVNAIGLNDAIGDSIIDVFVTAASDHFAAQAKLHFVCGVAAKKFNEKKDLFNKLSKELATHKFILTEFEMLKDLIYAFSEVTILLYPFPNFKC